MGNIYTTGPNEALVVSGGLCNSQSKSVAYGSWAWAWWCISDVQAISLEIMTLNPRCDHVETAAGVPLTVTGCAQVKIMTQYELLVTACEQFLGKSTDHIKAVLLQTLEGHLRAILGTLTVEAIYQDRDQFALMVREVAAPDLGRMGMEILSFTIKDVNDNVDYLDSLGRAQIANVKRDADIGVAEANRDAGIKEAQCDKVAMDTKYITDAKIEDSTRDFKMNKANFDMEVNTAKADAELAYELQAAVLNQNIRREQIMIEVIERRKQIEISQKEADRVEKELFGTVRLPAEGEAYRIETIAAGQRALKVSEAEGEAEKVKLIGQAEGGSLRSIGEATAAGMQLRAGALQKYGDAARLSMALEKMPAIAAEVAAPLAKTHDIVMIGGHDRATTEVLQLAASLPPGVQALTGVDLRSVISKVMQPLAGSTGAKV